ncbi:hypothetical protein EBB59_08595 [Lysobacter pythonis]|uniref:Uncharacterized protein n=1 Tax=Solilutibacter pythonis TaxID=2483112 RepID=A0A3M2HXU1_9GAMM|nr:hypothetical protein EBB59_08595 [Lysobacter pythonis]
MNKQKTIRKQKGLGIFAIQRPSKGHASAVCQLNLRGLDDSLAVISASTDNVEILHALLREESQRREVPIDQLRPEQWLERFYAERKGSGKQRLRDVQPAYARRASDAA